MYCKNCGNEIDESAVICTKCGYATEKLQDIGTKSKQKSGKYITSLIFLIISICANGIYFILMLARALSYIYINYALISLIYLIPITVCSIAIIKLNNVSTKKELTAISIITLIFGNIIAGIIMLTINDEDLKCNK